MARPRPDLRRLRRQCAAVIDDLRLPSRADLPSLCSHLAEVRKRPLHVVPVALIEQPCGMWVATRDADWIFVDDGTSPAHQEHILLHEIGHLICGHEGGAQDVAAFFPDLDPDLVHATLARTTYSDEQEQQAEVMAYLLAEVLRAPGFAAADDVTARIADSLNHSARREQR
ncbi:ImmA/IrrE family metallo-endopeptidase [Actinokineospora guangxiensis]|uniref:ImmA/IrrE family metallo-endopeptidase n=1 Tax=Actinokineospora guangxiensis TaxID=1490288 RepID=A0ABW0EUH0_9PSEU